MFHGGFGARNPRFLTDLFTGRAQRHGVVFDGPGVGRRFGYYDSHFEIAVEKYLPLHEALYLRKLRMPEVARDDSVPFVF